MKRAAYYNEAYMKLREDKDIASVLHMIDYEIGQWYPFNAVNNPDLERQVDKTFGYLDFLCYLRDRKLIGEKEFRNIEYRLFRVANNRSALDYLYNLYHFSLRHNASMSFSYLYEYLDLKQKIPLGFQDETSTQFVHHLIP